MDTLRATFFIAWEEYDFAVKRAPFTCSSSRAARAGEAHAPPPSHPTPGNQSVFTGLGYSDKALGE
eukprot:16206928-Heterocapsa_arctica.AAC.1